jgi:Tfp pilus assembly protein PilX
MPNRKGIVLTITVIFVLILTILAGAALLLWTNHARITERQVRRMRAFYTTEAGLTQVLDELRRTNTTAVYPLNTTVNLNGQTVNVNVGVADAQGIRNITATVANY